VYYFLKSQEEHSTW